jgi:magnesium-protoporphyrin IX monomethyl ester (oxidative) cyclase
MKILLVKSHSYLSAKGIGPQLGLGYIAAVLIKEGHDVKIKDLMLVGPTEAKTEFVQTVKEFKPDLVGITANSHERFYAFEVAAWAKQLGVKKVVMGGVHVTFAGQDTLKHVKAIDIIVTYEGEETMKELCWALENKEDLKKVKGILFRDGQGEIMVTPPRDFIKDLDSLPFPARNLFELEKYDLYLPIPGSPPVTQLVTARGCPFGCKFCSATQFAGHRIRVRSAKNVVDEIELILDKYPRFKTLFFYDDHFTFNKKRVLEICNEIRKRGLKFQFGCYGRVDSIDEELVEHLKSAGCVMISFGFESGSKKVLNLMGKRITPKQIEKAIKIVKKADIIARSSFFFGYPGETPLDVLKTFWLLRKCRIKSHEIVCGFHAILYPGTDLFRTLYNQGYFPDNFNWSERFNLPCYKDVPQYITKFDRLRILFIDFLIKFYRLICKIEKMLARL